MRTTVIVKGALVCAGVFFVFLIGYLFYSMRSKTTQAISLAAIVAVAFILRNVLPTLPSIFTTYKGVHMVLHLNRLVFWFFLFVGLIGAAATMAKTMKSDLGITRMEQLIDEEQSAPHNLGPCGN